MSSGGSSAAAEVYDVAIVGAGPAGCAAALAATAGGARVLLIDRGPRLGGNIGNALVHTICGLYLPAELGPAAYASPGLASRIADACAGAGAAGEVERAGKVYVLPTDPRRVVRLFEGWLAAAGKSAGLVVSASTELLGASAGESAERVDLKLRGFAVPSVRANLVIDASGDADAAALLGADFELEGSARLQNPSYILCLRGVDGAAVEGFARMRTSVAVAGAARKGTLPRGCESLVFRPGRAAGEVFVTVNLEKPEAFDPLDAAQRAALADGARVSAEPLVAFLRSERSGFARAEVAEFAERIGVREGRRVCGRERLEAHDVVEGRSHDEEVARSCWPIELWHGHERASFEHVSGACSVPLGALVSRSQPRLGMAGRCLSASHEALGSLRVIGTALATGEAIGTASAMAADAGTGLGEVSARRVRDAIAAASEEPVST